jgi:hypothetical protein
MHSLYRTVDEIIDTGRLGVPVFVRCIVQVAPGSEYVGNILARVLTMASSWLRSSPVEVYAQSHDRMRQITVTIKYTDGQTSIVSVSASGLANRVDLMLLGNKGALYHDGDALSPGFDINAEPIPVPDWLLDALERSLHDGEPAAIEEVTDFE